MTLREALRHGADQLKKHRCADTDPVREAEAILVAATGLPKERIFTDPDGLLHASARRRFVALVARRRRHEPLAYLLGTAWFMGHEFSADRRALIPRPATESIAAAAFAVARERRATLLADVGTGSGCIAIAAALALRGTTVVATDSSAPALALARKNARRLGAGALVRFRKGDLFLPARGAMARTRGPVIVVANLPYIPARAMRSLPPDLRREPRNALVGGPDGLAPSRRLLDQLARGPRPSSDVFFEILPEQFAPLTKAVRERFPRAAAAKIKNHQGIVIGLHARLE